MNEQTNPYLTSNRTLDDAISALGATQEQVWAVSENPTDQMPYPVEPEGITIAPSQIHGQGVFATKQLAPGEVLAKARVGALRTPAGRFCNHSGKPNAEMIARENGDVDLVASEAIEPGTEIVTDYYFNYLGTRTPKTPEQMRASILSLEAAMRAMPEHQVEIAVTHSFAKGVYLREIFIPKGVTLTGKIHKTEHMCILSKGEVSVWTGDQVERLQASSVVKSGPGAKRVLHAHEDSVWINVHPTDETDLGKLEDMLIAKSFEELAAFTELKQVEGDK